MLDVHYDKLAVIRDCSEIVLVKTEEGYYFLDKGMEREIIYIFGMAVANSKIDAIIDLKTIVIKIDFEIAVDFIVDDQKHLVSDAVVI